MLAVGLLTEAFIFALSAFEPVDNELDWSLVYPELLV
jgi:gliding motility-associated protein GldL